MTSVAVAAFRAATGRDPAGVWSAPGRINLVGEHTDYNDGFVLPLALDRRAAVAAGRRRDGAVAVRSVQRPAAAVVVPAGELAPGHPGGWAGYLAGAVWALRAAGHDVGGVDLVVDSAVPPGSGLSSSAALECAPALAAAELHGLDVAPAELARLAQRAENDFVGMPCGLMDQAAAMCCTADHALFLDTRSGAMEQVPFAPAAHALVLLVVDTHVRHALVDGAYADRRRACEEAARRLGVAALRDVPADGLDAALEALGDPALARRTRHVVTENARVLDVRELLGAPAPRFAEVGALLTASHRSLAGDFEVSDPALDTAVDAALAAGALGARMTGAGFGGCAIVLAEAAAGAAVTAAVVAALTGRGHPRPDVWPAVPSAGAGRDAGTGTPGAPAPGSGR